MFVDVRPRSAALAPFVGSLGFFEGELAPGRERRRLVHTFTLAQDPAHPSEVAVEFSAAGDGCAMRFAHGGWTDANAAARPKFGDWRVMLDRFAALVQV